MIMSRLVGNLLILVILPYSVTAQVLVQPNVPIAIAGDLKVSVEGKLQVASSFENNGTLIFLDSIQLAEYSGAGAIHATGGDQHLYLNNALIKTLYAAGGSKILHHHVAVDSLVLSNASIVTDTNRLHVTNQLTGYGADSYIVGPLVRSGADSLFYPIGDETIYAPVTLTSVVGDDPLLGVRFVPENPMADPGNGLLAVSEKHYWQIKETGGTLTGAQVQLPAIGETVVGDIAQASVAYGVSTGTRFRGLGQASATGSISDGTIKSANTAAAGIYAIGELFDEDLRKKDSLALVSIYESTNGPEWKNNEKWLTGSLDNWAGVSTRDKRVYNLNLSSNRLQGEFPTIAEGLEAMSVLNLRDNNLVKIGDISSLTGIDSLNVSENRLEFGSIEPLIGLADQTIYGPQKEVLQQVRAVQEIGETYTLDRTLTGTGNSYSWTKNGEPIDQRNGSFDVTIANFEADGRYVATVTSSVIPNLELTTQPILLRVSSLERDSASLRVIYDSLHGASSSLSDWTSLPITQWSEVTVTNSRVTGIDLSGSELSGALPEDIVDIKSLLTADLSNNDIDGLPELVGYLPNLTGMNVSGNRLTFEDLEPNAELTVLNYLDQQRFGEVRRDTVPAGTAVDLSLSVGGDFNEYQWYYTNHNTTDEPVNGLTAAELLLDSLSFATMGRYELRVRNSRVPDLILKSEYQTVFANADLTLTALGDGDASFRAGEGYALQFVAPGRPYDTARLVRGGSEGFVFEDLVLGNYLIVIVPDNLDEFLPTYYKGTDLWAEADTLLLRSTLEDSLRMAQVPGIATGTARVSGIVESDFEEEEAEGRIQARRTVKRAGCSVRRFVPKGRTSQEDGEYVLYAYVQSDDEGQFVFEDLEDGTYRFNIEYPGIPMDTSSYVEFIIGEGGIEDEELILEATITEEGIFVEKIERLGFYRKYFRNLTIYPNPANDQVKISYDQLLSANVTVRLMDLEGQVVREEVIAKGDNQELNLEVAAISGGIYLLTFVDTSEGFEQITTFKVVVAH